jgi:hypothetical protein
MNTLSDDTTNNISDDIPINKKDILINNITDVIANRFYPFSVVLHSNFGVESNRSNKNDNLFDKLINYFYPPHKYNLFDKLINYFYPPHKYENEFFKVEIKDNKFIYEIINNFEPESNLYSFLSGCKYYEFDIINNRFNTDGKINYRHLLMLNDFANFNLRFEFIKNDEFESYKEKIKSELLIFTEDKLINLIKDTYDKTKVYKYNFTLSVWKAPRYDTELIKMNGYKKNNFRYKLSDEEEINAIKNRDWYTGDGHFSPSAKIFSLRAKNYSSVMEQKLYYININININQLESWGVRIEFKPYDLLFKFEGGINFNNCIYTHWHQLLNNFINTCDIAIYHRPYYELINSSHKSNTYYTTHIPIGELIIFAKILEKEGAYISYKFEEKKE